MGELVSKPSHKSHQDTGKGYPIGINLSMDELWLSDELIGVGFLASRIDGTATGHCLSRALHHHPGSPLRFPQHDVDL